jgi:hypothetical protein
LKNRVIVWALAVIVAAVAAYSLGIARGNSRIPGGAEPTHANLGFLNARSFHVDRLAVYLRDALYGGNAVIVGYRSLLARAPVISTVG